eukprot:366498-Chlamydomonas_euryale.AAC.11
MLTRTATRTCTATSSPACARAPQLHAHAPCVRAGQVELGLLPLLADLAALCPDADRRAALMSSHASFLSSPAAADVPVGWMPPEAAAAAAAHGASEQCWPCGACTLSNAPGARSCEACGAQRPGGDGGGSVAEDDFPSLGVGSSNGGSGIGQHGSGGIGQQLSTGKKKKVRTTPLYMSSSSASMDTTSCMHSRRLAGLLSSCHNGAGRHCEIVTRRETDDVLRYREYGPASRRSLV